MLGSAGPGPMLARPPLGLCFPSPCAGWQPKGGSGGYGLAHGRSPVGGWVGSWISAWDPAQAISIAD